jgi:MFS family permease
MTAAMGLGAVVGGLWVAARGRVGIRALVNSAAVFGVVIAAAAVAPTLPLELFALTLVGAASVGFLSKGNSSLQLAASPTMRGRVMALWAVAFLGSTPIGGPIAGVVSERFGGRAGLALGAAACLLAAALGGLVLRRLKPAGSSMPATDQPPETDQVGNGSPRPRLNPVRQPSPAPLAAAKVTEAARQRGAA